MSTLTPQQLIAAQQANLNAFFGFANQAYAGFEKLVELNLQVGKVNLAETQAIVSKAVTAKDPAELFALASSLSQPASEKLAAYGRHVHEIVSTSQAEFSSAATAQFQQAQKDAQGFIESLAKNAPAGSEGAVAAWNSAFSAANATYESANKAAKQFVATVSAGA
ncbi:phasin family protein [Paraburkholderia sp. DHOC27]|uniref:phasin family protein n=1 Tax=Paraburkholderia sp. DHOC27 TaxID=2303330 RepID=UPI000E3BE467|nr:phasin family protein [Paraburkholderia sp. DHOC27]RFU48712.1 phasin family protein [Paraburkholderia sp. DHOC27]